MKIITFAKGNMIGEYFRFRQFVVRHDRSSMRVGTDAVLLGAWAGGDESALFPGAKILDVGCGCGLIALMVAQRFDGSQVLGLDIDTDSVVEARENALSSPFADRVDFCQADVRVFAKESSGAAYSLIVCNPPYYTEDTLPPDQRRSMARNALHLSFAELLQSVCRLMAEDGRFAVVIPMQARGDFVSLSMKMGLYVQRECRVQTVLRKTPKRVLLEFGFQMNTDIKISSLILQDSTGGRSLEYSLLCGDFYL